MAKIELSEEFIEKLDTLVLEEETYEECIKRLISGYEETFKNINREKEAFTLSFEGLDENDEVDLREYISISYNDLSKSNVGDLFEVIKLDYEYYINQKALVIFKDETSCFIKFIDEINTKSKKVEEFEIVAYHFI